MKQNILNAMLFKCQMPNPLGLAVLANGHLFCVIGQK